VKQFLCISLFLLFHTSLTKHSWSQSPPNDGDSAMLADQYPPPLSISASRNLDSPYGKNPSLESLVSLTEHESVSFLWFSTIVHFANGKNEAVNQRDLVLRLIRASQADIVELDALFNERKDDRARNKLVLNGYDRLEKTQYLALFGVKGRESSVGTSPLPAKPATLEYLTSCLKQYEELEWESESKWAKKLSEILDPIDLGMLAEHWINSPKMLHVPLSVVHLGLDAGKAAEMKIACREYQRIHVIKTKEHSTSELGISVERMQSDPELQESRLRVFSLLNPDQFKLATRMAWPQWGNTRTFAGRVEKIKSSESVAAKLELRLLRTVYEEGVRLGL
jgi:hypothetical protein